MTQRIVVPLAVVLVTGEIMTARAQPRGSAVDAEKRIEQESGRPFADVVRLRLWSIYGTRHRFAEDLGLTQEQLTDLLKAHEWELMPPPALRFQNRDFPPSAVVRASDGAAHAVDAFVDQNGKPSMPGTRAAVSCDKHEIVLSVTCDEPKAEGIVAATPARDPLPPMERLYWDGDLVPLRPALYRDMNMGQIKEWLRKIPPMDSSALLDDCLILFLTPVWIGKDQSYLAPAQLAPDPAKLVSELRPRKEDRIFLEGAFYFVAVNPNSAVLDVFYDPWDGGVFCPAWHSETNAKVSVGKGNWRAEVRIPLKSLKPNINEDSVWGVDLCRIRRCGAAAGEVTRGRETVFVRYDIPMRSGIRQTYRPLPSVSVPSLGRMGKMGTDRTAGQSPFFPTAGEWAQGASIQELIGNYSGRRSERTEVRIVHDERRLFVRFDCQERDITRLKVVTREEEEKEYGKGNRRCNYLDRREAYGVDWGDYVEVLLAPGLDGADPFHAGLFQFVVNSRGDLLERYYDTFGMFTVSPHQGWRSGTQVRMEKQGNRWSVELAIPFDVLCTDGTASKTWGLNLHRCISSSSDFMRDDGQVWLWGKDAPAKGATTVSRGEEVHLCWSPTYKMIRNVRRLGRMEIDPATIKPKDSPNRPGPAPARPEGAGREPINRQRTSDRLAGVCFVDAKYGWAVGGLGTILHTNDGGATWQGQRSGTDFILEKVFFLDRHRGWAVGGWPRDPALAIFGGMGVILATDDGGRNWRPQLDGEAAWLSDICFANASTGWAVGEYGTVMRTTDGGKSWRQMRNAPTPAWLYGVSFLDEKLGWAVGHYETILRTDDGGETWEKMGTDRTAGQSPFSPHRPFGWPIAYRAVRFANANEGWIVGDHGNILRTSDGGKTWARDEIEASDGARDLLNLTDLAVTENGTGWAVSPVALLSQSRNDEKWKPVKTHIPAWLRGISFADDANGWLVGERNTVLRTTDGGKTWACQRDSGREMGLLYATPHDHHINGSAIGALSEERDTAYALLGRVSREFEFGGDVSPHKIDAAAMALGVPVAVTFSEFNWRERDNPHRIAERYQHHDGIEPIEKCLVALIRALRPQVLVGEQPVVQEGYYAHGVGEVARAVVAAFDSAGDANRFPELRELGLEPFAPKKLYLISIWPNEIYRIHPATLSIHGKDEFSARLGMTHGEAGLMSAQCFWGLLDRNRPPDQLKPWPGGWSLHLKKSRVKVAQPEKDAYDGIR